MVWFMSYLVALLNGVLAMKEFKQHKLWRDKSLDYVIEHGTIANWRRLSDEEFDKRLREKLLEESQEVSLSKDHKELVEELADVFEVIESLIELHKISKDEIQLAQSAKKTLRGGFSGRKYVETTKHPLGSWQEEYCLKNPEKYPEMTASDSFAKGAPRSAARAVILCQDEVLFLCDKSFPEEDFSLPGGGIEFKESALDALKRELKEEIGLSKPIGRFLGCFEQHFKHYSLGDIHDLSFIFLVEITAMHKNLIKSLEARYECVWIALKDLAKVNLVPKELATLIPTWLEHDVNLALQSSFLTA